MSISELTLSLNNWKIKTEIVFNVSSVKLKYIQADGKSLLLDVGDNN